MIDIFQQILETNKKKIKIKKSESYIQIFSFHFFIRRYTTVLESLRKDLGTKNLFNS